MILFDFPDCLKLFSKKERKELTYDFKRIIFKQDEGHFNHNKGEMKNDENDESN